MDLGTNAFCAGDIRRIKPLTAQSFEFGYRPTKPRPGAILARANDVRLDPA